MKITLKVNPIECIAAANCVGIAPRFFQIKDDPYVELQDGHGNPAGTEYEFDATPEELELLREAADSCPTRAIEVVEEP